MNLRAADYTEETSQCRTQPAKNTAGCDRSPSPPL